MKKLSTTILLTVLFMLMLSTMGFCQDIDYSMNVCGSKITFSVNGNADETVSLLVYEGSLAEDNSIVFALTDKISESSIDFNVVMPDFEDAEKNISGTYSYTISKNGDVISDTFDYIGSNDRKAYIAELNSQSDLKSFFGKSKTKDMFNAFGIDYLSYKNSSDEIKDSLCSFLTEKLPIDTEDYDSFSEIFNSVSIPAYISAAKSESEIKNLLNKNKNSGIDISEIKDGAALDYIAVYLFSTKPFDDLDDVNEKIKAGNTMYIIKSENKAGMTDTIKKNARYLEIENTSEYEKYLSSSAIEKYVNEQIMLAVSEDGFIDISVVTDTFKDAVNSYEEEEPADTGGGSSGRGGSGSKGSVGVSADLLNPAVVDKSKELYSDLSEAEWARAYITELSEKGIINGDGDGKFNPNNNITREQFVKIISLAFLSDEYDAQISFDDVNVTEYYYVHIKRALGAGLVKGKDNGCFGVGENITREDAAVIIYRLLEQKSAVQTNAEANSAFNDSDSISEYAMTAVSKLSAMGIINGFEDNTFKPRNYLTRAEAAKIICSIAF